MNCQCAILVKSNKKYLLQCNLCKIKTIEPIKYNWYEYYIILIRDYPNFRLGIELFCLIGYIFLFVTIYFIKFKLINLENYELLGGFFAVFFVCYVVILFGYMNSIQQLNSNIRYKLLSIETNDNS
jgi:hypothetical protein